jgi:hypothetical protein
MCELQTRLNVCLFLTLHLFKILFHVTVTCVQIILDIGALYNPESLLERCRD